MDDYDPDHQIAFSSEWMSSAWNGFLPRQALDLHAVVATATARKIDGPLDHLVAEVLPERFDGDTGGLSGPTWFSYPGDEEDPEQFAMDEARRAEYEATLSRAGLTVPATVRELAFLMADIGVFERTVDGGVERWRSPTVLPVLAEQLPVSELTAKRDDRARWGAAHRRTTRRIVAHVQELARAEVIDGELPTTLTYLASYLEVDLTDLRFALGALLSEDSAYGLLDARTREAVDPEVVDHDTPVALTVDWDGLE